MRYFRPHLTFQRELLDRGDLPLFLEETTYEAWDTGKSSERVVGEAQQGVKLDALDQRICLAGFWKEIREERDRRIQVRIRPLND